jgi:DNA-binding NtrC family response regulator
MAAASRTVLVVDDDEMLRNLLCRMLERLDRRVLLAANAESALALFQHSEERIDLVISDARLSGMNGLMLAEELRLRDSAVAILLLSGSFDEPTGDFPELDKPFTLEALRERIDEILEPAPQRAGDRAKVDSGA